MERICSESFDEETKLQIHLEDEQDRGDLLSQELEELHNFLSDYGHHWVGGPPYYYERNYMIPQPPRKKILF